MHSNNHLWLTQAPIAQVLARQTLPMLAAIFMLFAYDVLESQLLSKVSLEVLTVLGFTVPVTTAMTAYAIAMTITTNTAVTKVLSRNKAAVPVVIINAMIVTVALSLFFAMICYLLNDEIFAFLGIDYAMLPDSFHHGPRPKLMPLAESYMQWRYLGWVFLVLIWQVNSLLRAVGLVNWAGGLFIGWLVTKMLLAHVWLGPATEQANPLEAAALVHLFSDTIFALISIGLLFTKLNLLPHNKVKIAPFATFRRLSKVGLPATIQQLLTPLSITLLTIFVVSYGQVYVAVLGIIFRLEALLLLIPMVLTTSLPSIVGVNWWSGHKDRVSKVLRQSKILVCLAQLLIAVVLFFAATEVADLFKQGEHVKYSIETYLKLVPIGLIGAGITIICQSSFNATGHYIKASILSISHRFVFKLSCCYLGLYFYGIQGLFAGLLLAHLLSAVLAVILNRQILRTNPAYS